MRGSAAAHPDGVGGGAWLDQRFGHRAQTERVPGEGIRRHPLHALYEVEGERRLGAFAYLKAGVRDEAKPSQR